MWGVSPYFLSRTIVFSVVLHKSDSATQKYQKFRSVVVFREHRESVETLPKYSIMLDTCVVFWGEVMSAVDLTSTIKIIEVVLT